jgi:hypothetical protein
MKNLLSLLLIVICVTSISANMAAPSQGGQTLTEPAGVKNIEILHEDLTFDLSQLGDETVPFRERFIDVEAVYEVNNPTDIPKLDLVFVIVSESKNFRFFADNTEIKTETIDNADFADRKTWKVPSKTPFEGKELMYNPANGSLKSAKFSLKLSKGKHTLRAKYKAELTINQSVGITKAWQFAYLSAPARDWKSFGGLRLDIKIPAGWSFDSNLKLERIGDSLSGNFTEIPADAITLTTQMPIPENYNSTSDFYYFIFVPSLFAAPLFILLLAFWKGYKWRYNWAYGFLFGILWAGSSGLSGLKMLYAGDALIPKAQQASYGYGDGIGFLFMIILTPIIFVIGTLLWVGAVLTAGKVFKQT